MIVILVALIVASAVVLSALIVIVGAWVGAWMYRRRDDPPEVGAESEVVFTLRPHGNVTRLPSPSDPDPDDWEVPQWHG